MPEKIALVGIGKIARDQHIPSIHADKDWELAAVASRNASLDGVDNFSSLDELLEKRPDISTISLAIPPQPRFDYAVKALKARRHVMLEKPPGQSLAECFELEKLAKEMGVTLYASWHSRAADCVPDAKDWLAGKTLKSLRITWKEDVRRWHPGQDWIFEPGGMGVFDPGINALSIMTEILPDPVHVQQATLAFPENRDTPIAAQLMFHHSGGAQVTAEFDWLQEGLQSWDIEVETAQGTMKLAMGGSKMFINDELVKEGADHEYANLYRRMAELVQAEESDVDLLPLVHVSDAFALGRRVTVAPFEF
ncbi:Gfo/Idh/MocA family oxidoreductase [Pseudovibrio exalbescens]|uniref:Gfo/Idh/MocA family protein n=1 Tax=Pseudovibrio exalbescens TaxID=197461 RepID=UPI0023670C61|nr:Gfo/Idh/MocA family oxidoreductase [Pseudovibrio exalbescens]MDD7911960.1 Gfo/Idh/MocA family oxidoreductase [Pseudovibrio exalbescens]